MKVRVGKHTRKCGTCQNFYDPTNSAIVELNLKVGIVVLDCSFKSQCAIRGGKYTANAACANYKPKF